MYEDRKIRDLTVAWTLVEQLSTNRSHVGTIKKIDSYQTKESQIGKIERQETRRNELARVSANSTKFRPNITDKAFGKGALSITVKPEHIGAKVATNLSKIINDAFETATTKLPKSMKSYGCWADYFKA